MLNLLLGFADDSDLKRRIAVRLQTGRERYPRDVSLLVADILLTDSADRGPAINELLQILREQPLDPPPTGQLVTRSQRERARARIPVWLVARELLQSQAHQDAAQELAEFALEAASRQRTPVLSASILLEWSRRNLDHDDRAVAERNLSRLLSLLTARPGDLVSRSDSSNDASGAPASPEPTAPPLTETRYFLARHIGELAARSGLSSVSQRAVRIMVASGAPFPDRTDSVSASDALRLQAANDENGTFREQQIGSALMSIVSRWDGPEYSPNDVCDILWPIVLPPQRPGEILLYVDTRYLADARVRSAADLILPWTQAAGRLDELADAVERRMESPAAQLPGRALLTRIALLQKNLPAAQTHLTALAGRVEQTSGEALAHNACLAALPAFQQDALRDTAFRILSHAVHTPVEESSSPLEMDRLYRQLHQYLVNQGRANEVRDSLEDYLRRSTVEFSEYGDADYTQVMQCYCRAAAATEAALSGLNDLALHYLGQVCDASVKEYPRPPVDLPLVCVLNNLAELSAEERYQRLRDWTLPQEGRRSIRVAVVHTPFEHVPDRFLKDRPSARNSLRSNITDLLEAAQETNQLDDLLSLAQTAEADSLKHSRQLVTLIHLQRGDMETAIGRLQEFVADFSRRHEQQADAQADLPIDSLLWLTALQSQETATAVMPLLQPLRQALWQGESHESDAQIGAISSRIDSDFATARARELDIPPVVNADANFVWWTASEFPSERVYVSQPWWVEQDNRLVHLHGTPHDQLIFNAPLAGNFEFTMESSAADHQEICPGFNGVIPLTSPGDTDIMISSVSGHEHFSRSVGRTLPAVNQFRIRVQDGEVTFRLNDQQVWQETVQPTSPWLMLYTIGHYQSAAGSLQLSGQPEVLDEIPLIHDDMMEGWCTRLFDESQPENRDSGHTRRHSFEGAFGYPQTSFTFASGQDSAYDWYAQNGVLHGRAQSGMFAQSHVSYFRPLQNRASVSCEFYYRPGCVTVAPCLGRTAWLLQPAGLQTHWIATEREQRLFGVPADNAQPVTENALITEPLPLKADDWNQLTLALQDGVVQLTLNSVPIYSGPAPQTPDTHFGFYRDRRCEALIRNIVHRGPWKEQYQQLTEARLTETGAVVSPQLQQIHREILSSTVPEHQTTAPEED